MQLAAKIVYYGPGLCGKTTNLQHIYEQTPDNSRGEMVSLETATDRTSSSTCCRSRSDRSPASRPASSSTPSRVRCSTTPPASWSQGRRRRRLRRRLAAPMYQANIDSLQQPGREPRGMGLSIDSIPMVLQFNKRDLSEICTVEELNEASTGRLADARVCGHSRRPGLRDAQVDFRADPDRACASGSSGEAGRPVAAAAPPKRPASSSRQPVAARPRRRPSNGHRELSREIELAVASDDCSKARRCR